MHFQKMATIIGMILLVFMSDSELRSQTAAESEIRAILDEQSKSWNKGDLDAFMKSYWNNDSLMFIGSNGVVYGYQNTLQRYKKSYSDRAQMGKLKFEILHVNRLSPEYYYVVGKWFLKRSVGDIGGYYNLLFRKIRGSWKIVADHSS